MGTGRSAESCKMPKLLPTIPCVGPFDRVEPVRAFDGRQGRRGMLRERCRYCAGPGSGSPAHAHGKRGQDRAATAGQSGVAGHGPDALAVDEMDEIMGCLPHLE